MGRLGSVPRSFFHSMPEAERVPGVATHINKFWEPRMRAQLFELIDQGGAGLDPLVLEAAAEIRRPEHVDAH